MEAAPRDRALFADLAALTGDGSLPGAARGGVLRPSGHTPDGLLCVVVHLAGDWHRAADDGGDYLPSEALLALCGLRSSGTHSPFTGGGRESRMNTSQTHRLEKSATSGSTVRLGQDRLGIVCVVLQLDSLEWAA